MLRIFLVGLTLPVATCAQELSDQDREFFESKVRPLLVERCHKCHGEKKQQGGLRLDSKEYLIKGGDSGPAAIAKDVEESLLVQAIRYDDVGLRMPPDGKLPEEEIAILEDWIKRGIPWTGGKKTEITNEDGTDWETRKKHWSFQPVTNPDIPKIEHREWANGPIDHFLVEKLEAAGMLAAPVADKRTLIRRVTFDLTGLPPTPEEIEAFLADESPDAWSKLVDRLLDSPQYGERWGRHWLDLVRYSDTLGHEFDFEIPHAYEYRDYVIRAHNRDIPLNTFVQEHIAGDLFEEPRFDSDRETNESILGTGFFWLGEGKHSPVDVRAEEAAKIDNQIDVFSKAFLGLTLACSRCHDHKFDPLTSRDYYSLAGFLQSSRRQIAYLDREEPHRNLLDQIRQLRQTSWEPASRRLPQQIQSFLVELPKVAHQLNQPVFDADVSTITADAWEEASQGSGVSIERLKQWHGLLRAAKNTPSDPLYLWTLPENHPLAALAEKNTTEKSDTNTRLESFESPLKGWFRNGLAFDRAPLDAREALILKWSANDPQVAATAVPGVIHSAADSTRMQGGLFSPTFELNRNRVWLRVAGREVTINLILDGFHEIRAPIYGGLTVSPPTQDRFEWVAIDVSMWQGHRAYLEFLDNGNGFIALDEIQLSNEGPLESSYDFLTTSSLSESKSLGQAQTKWLDLVRSVSKQLTGSNKEQKKESSSLSTRLFDKIWNFESVPRADDSVRSAIQELENKVQGRPRGLALMEGTPENEHIFIRGNHKNLGQEVPRRNIEIFDPAKEPKPLTGSGRLELARALTSASNPLFARVMVNRIWLHHFGEGIVRTPDDFGRMGQPPTHPELLDYLATRLVEEGWSMKRLHKEIMLSQAYQRSSRSDPLILEKDPLNLLWHSRPPRRLEAEPIRDAILSISGRLDQRRYGPGVMPYLTPHMDGRGRPGASGPLDGEGRRSVYLAVRRNFLNPLFLAFDYPLPTTTVGKRGVSNVPAQALSLMNNPFVIEESRRWAQKVLALSDRSDEEKLAIMYEEAYSRLPTPEETRLASEFLLEQSREYQNNRIENAWTDLAQVLINAKEFWFVP